MGAERETYLPAKQWVKHTLNKGTCQGNLDEMAKKIVEKKYPLLLFLKSTE